MSDATDLYRGVLMEHFHHPRNHGSTEGAQAVSRVDNPLCGDDLEVGVTVTDGVVSNVTYRARGCAICIASGSMMTEVVKGTAVDSVRTVEEAVTGWFAETDAARPDDLPEPLPALAAVKDFPARSRCVTLAWEALAQALSAAGEGQRSAAEHDS